MAQSEEKSKGDNVDEEENDKYKVAAKVSSQELLNKDKDDEALQKYKKSLLGDLKDIIIDDKDKRQVFFDKFILLAEGRPAIELIPKNLSKEQNAFVLKEGSKYKLKIIFRVQREVVFGLKKQDTIYRKGVRVDKTTEMMGAFKPSSKDIHEYTFPEQTTPSGMLARGKYVAKTVFLDDDGNQHTNFEYGFQIAKDWNGDDK
jgi:Rho GDP-dissociation inhibitor